MYAGVDAAAWTGDVDFGAAYELIRTDEALEAFTTRARLILETHGKGAEYAAHKRGARAITWGGRFTRRANANLQAPSGAVFADVDDLDSAAEAEAERARVSAYPFTALAYISLSGRGIHVVARVTPIPSTPAEYTSAWTSVMTALGYDPAGRSAADRAVSDIARLAFIAHDPGAYANPNAVGHRWFTPPPPNAPAAAATPPKRAYAGAGGGGELLTLEEAVAAAGAHSVGGSYRAKCLIHKGVSDDSLSIDMKDGALLVRCFAGCEPTDILAELRKAAGKREATALVYCAGCNRDGVRKPQYAVCYECRPRNGRRREYAAVALRQCKACGRHLESNGGHAWDDCSPEFKDLSPRLQREYREARRKANLEYYAAVAAERAGAAPRAEPAPAAADDDAPPAFAPIPAEQIAQWRAFDDFELGVEFAMYEEAGDADCVAAIQRIQAERAAAATPAEYIAPPAIEWTGAMPLTAGALSDAPNPALPCTEIQRG